MDALEKRMLKYIHPIAVLLIFHLTVAVLHTPMTVYRDAKFVVHVIGIFDRENGGF